MAKDLGTENGCYDLTSTHTKYSSSQSEHLIPLDGFLNADELSHCVPRVLDLWKINGTLMQLPRNLDARLLFYRADLCAAIGP